MGTDEGAHIVLFALVSVDTGRGAGDARERQPPMCPECSGKLAAYKRNDGAHEGVAVADDDSEQFNVKVDDGSRIEIRHVGRRCEYTREEKKRKDRARAFIYRAQRPNGLVWRSFSPDLASAPSSKKKPFHFGNPASRATCPTLRHTKVVRPVRSTSVNKKKHAPRFFARVAYLLDAAIVAEEYTRSLAS